jgi:hypothetical protein
MTDDIRFYAKLDGLPPAEKLRDSKGRVVREEFPPKKREGKRKEEATTDTDIDTQKEEGTVDSSEERQSGKIVDIVI